ALPPGAPGGGPASSPLLFDPNLGPPDRRYQENLLAPNYNSSLPNPSFTSQWAEVAWFLVPTGELTVAATSPAVGAWAQPTRLHTLYRRQLVAVPERLGTKDQIGGNPAYVEVSKYLNNLPIAQGFPVGGPGFYAASPSDLTVPNRRFGMAPNTPAG